MLWLGETAKPRTAATLTLLGLAALDGDGTKTPLVTWSKQDLSHPMDLSTQSLVQSFLAVCAMCRALKMSWALAVPSVGASNESDSR